MREKYIHAFFSIFLASFFVFCFFTILSFDACFPKALAFRFA